MTDQHGTDTGNPGDAGGTEELPPRPAFFKRLWMVFVQPGDLFRLLALNPAWFPAAAFAAVVAGLAMWMIPAEAFTANISPEQAAQMPDIPPGVIKIFGAGAVTLGLLAFPVVLSLITYVFFVFIRSDRATFKQHLCVISHTGFITAFGSLFTLPLRIRSADMQQALSVGTFFPFVPEGYLLSVLMGLQLFALWAAVIAGLGLSVIDPRRNWGPTAAVLVGLTVAWAMITAIFTG